MGFLQMAVLSFPGFKAQSLTINGYSHLMANGSIFLNPLGVASKTYAFSASWAVMHIPTVVGHPFRFISDSHSNSKRTPVPIDIGQRFRFHIGHFSGASARCPISSEGCPTCLGTVSEMVETH